MDQFNKLNDYTSEFFTIENYSIEKNNRLGGGVQGEIFKAKMRKVNDNGQVSHEEIVAKIIRVNDMNKNMCQREKEILLEFKKKPSNINVVQTYDIKTYIEDGETFQLSFMEKCDCDLKNFMDQKLQSKSNQWFSYQEILNIASQIIKGYKLLLECNIIHRDLKPENILVKQLNNEIVLKICDFGIGKCLNQDYAITNLGTPFYTPKEGLSSEPYTNKFDVYSLGIIFYQLVYQGKYPFEKKDFHNFLNSIKDNPLTCPPISNIPKQFLQLIEDMITYSPDTRIGWKELMNQEVFSDFFQVQKSQSENPVFNLIQYYMLIYMYSNRILKILQKLPKDLEWNCIDALYLESIVYLIQNSLIEQLDQLKNKKQTCIQSLVRSISAQQLEEANSNEINQQIQNYQLELHKQKKENQSKLADNLLEINKFNINQNFHPLSIFSEEKKNQETFEYWLRQYDRAYKDLLRAWLQDYYIKKIFTQEDLYQLEKFGNISQEFPQTSFNEINKNELQSKIVAKEKAEVYLKHKGIF